MDLQNSQSEKSLLESFEQFPWIKRCLAYESFNSFLNKRNINLPALNDAIRVISESSLRFDFYHVNHIRSALRFGHKEIGNQTGKVAGQFEVFEKNLIVRFPKRYGREKSIKIKLADDLNLNARRLTEELNNLTTFFKTNSLIGEGHWPRDYDEEVSVDEIYKNNTRTNVMNGTALNQILYGPPGTGKTYYTIEAAVKAAHPEFTWKSRKDLKMRYDELINAKRIRFVTFHQSYGYEEFVEGISADTDEKHGISYNKQNGIFKQICSDASNAAIEVNDTFNLKGKVWKLSIGGAHSNPNKTYCLENNLGAIGWAHTGDLSEEGLNDYHEGLGKNAKNTLEYFSNTAEVGELVLCINSKTSIEAVGVITGDYQYQEQGLPSDNDYRHHLPIKWLAKGINVDFKELNGNTSFNLSTFYPLRRLTPAKVFEHLEKNGVEIAEYKKKQSNEVDNYVLIIDEINRGNISKIFGELITLIEESKRIGNEEEIKLTLPVTGDEFGVPNNVYIIGTMNTADRSLAMMDTALRRRFDFVEMMPDYQALRDEANAPYVIKIDEKEIDLVALLSTLNKRITALYDREHQLGHAFLMPVVKHVTDNHYSSAVTELKNCFQNKIIPLLAEYFFEDWEKIRLVLGDNQKEQSSRTYQLIEHTSADFESLFGNNHDLGDGEKVQSFELISYDNEIWDEALTYIGMYDVKKFKSQQEG